MRGCHRPASPLYPKIRFAFTDHPITVWAGAILLRLYFELISLRAALVPLLAPFAKTSNNQIASVDVLLAWWYSLRWGSSGSRTSRGTAGILCCLACSALRASRRPIRSGASFPASRPSGSPRCPKP